MAFTYLYLTFNLCKFAIVAENTTQSTQLFDENKNNRLLIRVLINKNKFLHRLFTKYNIKNAIITLFFHSLLY